MLSLAFTSKLEELLQKRFKHSLVLGNAHPIQSPELHSGKVSTFPIRVYSCNIVQGQKYRKKYSVRSHQLLLKDNRHIPQSNLSHRSAKIALVK